MADKRLTVRALHEILTEMKMHKLDDYLIAVAMDIPTKENDFKITQPYKISTEPECQSVFLHVGHYGGHHE